MHLPASIACLSHHSIKLFTKFRALSIDKLYIATAKDGRFHIRMEAGSEMNISWPMSIPESKRVDSSRGVTWLMPPTDTFALCVMLAWEDSQIEYEDEITETKMQILRAMIHVGDLTARTQANYKLAKVTPQHDLYYNSEIPPTDYQQTASYCALNHLDGYGLFMEQGTGKTPVAIQVMDNECEKVIAEHNRPYRAIIVTPNNVRRNWVGEINRFAVHKFRTTVIAGEQLARVRQFCDAMRDVTEAGTVVITSYDTLTAAWDVLQHVKWDLAVLDEAHYIKNTRTRRYRTCLALRDRSTRRIAATGTPVANTPLDLYAIWEFLGKGYSGFHSQKGFNKFYGKYRVDPQHGALLVGTQENKLPLLQERLARMSFGITLKEALPSLPEKVYDIIEVEMTPEQKKLYEKVATDINIEIENVLKSAEASGQSQPMVINNVLTMMLKLSQVTSGHLHFPDFYDQYGNIIQEAYTHVVNPNPKVDELVRVMKEKKPHEKTLIWACYTQDIRTISEALRNAGLDGVEYTGETTDQQRQEREWRYNNDPSCRWFLGNAGAGGTGLNLLGYEPHSKDPTTFTTHIIYFSQDWSQIKRSQSEARGHRRGTLTNVRVSDLVIPNTIDEEIRVKVLEKKKVAITLGDLRPILSKILESVGV